MLCSIITNIEGMDSFDEEELVYTIKLPNHETFTLNEKCINMSGFISAIYLCDQSYERCIQLQCSFSPVLVADVFCYISYHTYHNLNFPAIPKPIPMIHPSVESLKPHVNWFSYTWVAHRSDEELIELYKIASYFLVEPVLDILNACIACKCNCIYITKKIANK